MLSWTHHRWRAMGSWAEVLVLATDGDALVERATAAAEEMEACWSRFRATSELCALNRRAGHGPQHLSPLLHHAIASAADAWRATVGLFDPTVLVTLVDLGYDRDCRGGLGPGRPCPRPTPGFASVAIDHDAPTITLPPHTAIDLGGIGKGLAADLIASDLHRCGAAGVCVSMGGDLRVAGVGPDDGAWLVPIEDPRNGRTIAEFPLVDEAIAQSTTLLRRWRSHEGWRHHVIDPRSSRPTDNDAVAAIVTARDTVTAECFAKAALVAGPDAGIELLEQHGLDGWLLVAGDGVAATTHVRDVVFAC